MTTAKDDIPVQDALFLVSPPTPKGPEHKRWQPWHIAVMTVGVPLVAFLSAVGANTVSHWWLVDALPAHTSATASASPNVKKTKAPEPPRYDLAGFRSATTGPAERAFASALYALRADVKKPDYPAALTDSPRLTSAASEFLALVKAANPPPSYGPAKLGYIQAALAARKAGTEALEALQTANLGLLQKAAGDAARAQRLLIRAPSSEPHGS
jgi:hypothetical protein